ncbi:protein inturned [Ischnura elegans]|uniref:protein inturned n=1 Tax=Ischnura elegans TaxID=197161 RepID=UPI001ED8BEE4|nr:protein inturned [Ischnura elegans]
MDDICESEALLPRTLSSRHKPCRGDGGSTTDEDDSCGRNHDWWDDTSSGSSCSSYSCSDSDYEDHRSDIEWETSVDPRGDVFYVESNVPLVPNLKVSEDPTSKGSSSSKKKTSAGRLVGLISYKKRANKKLKGWLRDGWNSASNTRSENSARNTSTRGSRQSSSVWPNRGSAQGSGGGNKVTFRDSQEGEAREVGLHVDPGRRNLGRRATLCETLLGIVPGVFSSSNATISENDGELQALVDDRIMVAGFVPDGEAIKNRSIKIGDWLRKIDGTEVTFKTIDRFLSSIISSCTLKLTLQRVAGCDVTADLPHVMKSKPLEQSKLVRTLTGSGADDIRSIMMGLPVGLLYLTFPSRERGKEANLSGEEDEFSDVIYCYPPGPQANPLAPLRGSFLTLNQLVPQVTQSAPISSTILLKGQKTHVVYASEGSELLLVAAPDNCCSIPEAILLTEELISALRFSGQTLNRAFSDPSLKPGLDRHLDMFFTRVIIGGFWSNTKLSNVCTELTSKAKVSSPHLFEEILPASHFLSMPHDVQNQIDDALNQLEAADFQCLNEEHHQCQRLFNIVGSCLYYKGFLISSHLPCEDLPYVHSYLTQLGIIHLCRTEPVRSLVFWKEIYLNSCNRGLQSSSETGEETYPTPEGRWFLLVVGKGQGMLVVLMEMGGCSISEEGSVPPEPDYVDHAKTTLNHIHEIGIPAVCDSWLTSGGLPRVDSLESLMRNLSVRKGFRGRSKNKSDASFLSFRRSSEPTSPKSCNSGNSGTSPHSPHRRMEVTSILKRRDSPGLLMPQGTVNSCGVGGDTTASEDSVSIGGTSAGGNGREGSITYGFGSDDSSSVGGLPSSGVVGRRAQRECTGTMRQSSSTSSLGAAPLSVFPTPPSPLGVSISSRSSVSDCEDDDDSSGCSDWELYRGHSRSRQSFDLDDLKNTMLNGVTNLNPIKLTSGEKNVLLFYLSVDESQGVFVCPPNFPANDCSSSMQHVIENFRRSCLHIHNLLQHSIAFKDVKGPDASASWINKSLVAVKEHGVLFECPNVPSQSDSLKKSSNSPAYWVVGRLFFSPQPKEVYVCYFDSAPQNMVEIAFRLGLSVSG